VIRTDKKMKTNHIQKQTKSGKIKELATVRMSGKIKECVEKHKISHECVGSNYNGYGWSDFDHYYIISEKGAKEFLGILTKPKKEVRKRTDEEIIESWCKRLSSLTGIDFEDAQIIAKEKIEYKEERIAEMEERNWKNPSRMRDKLIRKMERENPLRRIEDVNHAFAILAASERHNNSNYDDMLEEAKELAAIGDIDKSEIKDYARQNYSKY